METISDVTDASSNGFRPRDIDASHRGYVRRRFDANPFVSVAGAAAGLAVPISGVAYGVIRVGYDEYYRGLGLTPEIVGLSQAAIVSGVAVVVGFLAALVATWVSFGVLVYRLIAPLRSGQADADRSWWDWCQLGSTYLAALGVAAVPALLAKWATGAVFAGLIAVQLSWVLADTELRLGDRLQRATRSAYAGTLPRVGLLLTLTVVGGALIGLTLNFWHDTARAGQVVRETGRLPEELYLNVTTSPARVIAKGDDPLKVCDGSRKAVLVGRHDGVSYVLLLPGKDTDPPSEVVPLSDSDYAVATATAAAQPCQPITQAP